MKRTILSLALVTLSLSGLAAVANATDLQRGAAASGCQLDAAGYHNDEYHVEYYDRSCGHWKCYGVYGTKCKAVTVAEKLSRYGYKVRIELQSL